MEDCVPKATGGLLYDYLTSLHFTFPQARCGTVLVGKEEKHFMVHKDVVCNTSPIFRTACSKEWKEANERTVRLPEPTPSMFAAYLHYIYRGQIELSDRALSISGDTDVGKRTDAHIEIFLLADFLQDQTLGEGILKSFVTVMETAESTNSRCLPGRHTFKFIYDNASESSLLRKLVVDAFILRFSRKPWPGSSRHSRQRSFLKLLKG